MNDEVPDEGERFEALLQHPKARIDRIVSSSRPEPVVYDQDHDEWVMVLTGSATLDIEGDAVLLRPGQHVLLPAHRRDRVVRTDHGTVWLAVHFDR